MQLHASQVIKLYHKAHLFKPHNQNQRRRIKNTVSKNWFQIRKFILQTKHQKSIPT